ncbi:DUF503 domain-containing protein [Mumia sp. zg.B53]|uniref:DUF503 domain-containing protein n=1 Tax=unclassified Mumia TaxID=2621872 RepID=UPI001C6E98B8|nr:MULTISPECIES: DUF503 domain-containing protein [unclassified Mumia]MBW9207619.1 DUF503 domain-containing protein [Mumia sp. zg.B17]MBW9210035.1 DUF503 domain-containing protein [Mumia sp. zg.B21]MBW9214639.1 DUF503 domain-containing protein [Mumia sp. zg.B53]MDD9348892.1 DUF503 domain-containing protein [Mumia sp.]
MWVGTIEFSLLLGDVHTLKEKRAFVRPLVSDLRRTFDVSVAETDDQDLYRRASIGVAVVAGDNSHVIAVLDKLERFVASRPEVDLLGTHRSFFNTED